MTEDVPQSAIEIRSRFGTLRGIRDDRGVRFLGIPYATPPLGKLRFAPPKPAEPWSGVRDATNFGASAMQERLPGNPAFAHNRNHNVPISEDCLTLNVYSPAADSARRPVMVWVHGGGMATGMGSAPVFKASTLAAFGDVVVVTVNHRLNVFGFFNPGTEAGKGFAGSANAGLLDLVAALRWVRDAIDAFGGDPDCVTIFGVSGGGGKIGRLMGMEAAKGLFHRAIIQSTAMRAVPPELAVKGSHNLLERFGLAPGTADKLRDVPSDTLLQESRATARALGVDPFQPSVDDLSLSEVPFRESAPEMSRGIPLIVGTCAAEAEYKLFGQPAIEQLDKLGAMQRLASLSRIEGDGATEVWRAYEERRPGATPYEIYRDILTDQRFRLNTLRTATLKSIQDPDRCWLYRFAWTSPVAGLTAPHTADVPFIFGTCDAARAMLGDSPGRTRMQDIMMAAWTSFARTGQPKAEDLPDWKPFAENHATMILSEDPACISDPPAADIASLEAFRIDRAWSTDM